MSGRDETGYGQVARALHWTAAVALIATFLLALGMDAAPRGALRDGLKVAHYTAGVLALGFGLARLGWRLFARGPALEGGVLQVLAAKGAHVALIALGIAVPLSGLAVRWARGRSVELLGGISLPPPVAIPGGRAWGEVHEAMAWGFVLVVGLHVAAVAWHALVLRDGTLRRMWGAPRRVA